MTDLPETCASCSSSQVLRASTSGLLFSLRTVRRASALLPRIVFSIAYSAAMRSRASLAIGAEPPFAISKNFSSQVCPAEGERDRVAGPCIIGNGLVSRVSVALHDAAIALEQLERVDGAAARCIGVGDGGRIGSTPRPVIAGDRPEVSLLRASTAWIELPGATVSSTAILTEAE